MDYDAHFGPFVAVEIERDGCPSGHRFGTLGEAEAWIAGHPSRARHWVVTGSEYADLVWRWNGEVRSAGHVVTDR